MLGYGAILSPAQGAQILRGGIHYKRAFELIQDAFSLVITPFDRQWDHPSMVPEGHQ